MPVLLRVDASLLNCFLLVRVAGVVMPRAIVIDLTSLSDSDGAHEARLNINAALRPPLRHGSPSIEKRLVSWKGVSQRSKHTPPPRTRTRASSSKHREHRTGNITHSSGDIGQTSRWQVTPRDWKELDNTQRCKRRSKIDEHVSSQQPTNSKGASTKAGPLVGKGVRRSNLVDDLLRSGSGNDADSDSDASTRAPTLSDSTRKFPPSVQRRLLSSRDLPSMTQPLNNTQPSIDRQAHKRVRLSQGNASDTGWQGAMPAAGTHLSESSSFLASQHGMVSKRRGRPPGSRNKTKVLADVLPSRSPMVKETLNSATSDFPMHQPLLIHYTSSTRTLSRASLLRHRELGGCPILGPRNIQDGLRQAIIEQQLSPWKCWDGASKDVITGAWSPNGNHFVVGASTDLDSLNLRYNRNNNLLWGDLEQGLLTELPDHCLPREASANDGSNSQGNDVSDTLDPRVFTTVSSVCFNTRGDQMYTSSYDKKVKIWRTQENKAFPKCISDLVHGARVELLEGRDANERHLLATAQRESKQAISVFSVKSDDPEVVALEARFTSDRAERMNYFPTALRWGTVPSRTEHLLLAGFAEDKNNEFERDRQGDLLLWDAITMEPHARLTPAAQCVFDLAWHPRLPIMAVATTPGPLLGNKKTKSVVRTWSPLESGSRIMEFECPALDINEICFHPSAQHYICAACTNSCAYLWDIRRPDEALQILRHGKGIEEINRDRSIEDQDTGMRFISWGLNGSHLYTGSSDGLIKQWNPFLAEEDAMIRDIAAFDSGIMTGSFSPDYSNLLVGLCKGSVQVLSSALPSESEDMLSVFSFRPSP